MDFMMRFDSAHGVADVSAGRARPARRLRGHISNDTQVGHADDSERKQLLTLKSEHCNTFY